MDSEEQNIKLDGLNECEFCHKSFTNKYNWNLLLTNGGRGGFFNRMICTNCVNKITKAPMNRIRFFETIIDYARKNKLDKYTSKHWSIFNIEELKKILNEKNIPIINYGIPIYVMYRTREKIYLHNFRNKMVS